MFCAFWVANVLRATAACHFLPSELAKSVPQCGVCTFWLENVLRATAACHFLTSERPKLVRARGVLYILPWKCALCHSGVPFFICLLNSHLRTRRFSEATFRTSIIEKTQRFATSLTFGARVPSFWWLYTRVDLLSADLTSLLCFFNSAYILSEVRLLYKLPSIIGDNPLYTYHAVLSRCLGGFSIFSSDAVWTNRIMYSVLKCNWWVLLPVLWVQQRSLLSTVALSSGQWGGKNRIFVHRNFRLNPLNFHTALEAKISDTYSSNFERNLWFVEKTHARLFSNFTTDMRYHIFFGELLSVLYKSPRHDTHSIEAQGSPQELFQRRKVHGSSF